MIPVSLIPKTDALDLLNWNQSEVYTCAGASCGASFWVGVCVNAGVKSGGIQTGSHVCKIHQFTILDTVLQTYNHCNMC